MYSTVFRWRFAPRFAEFGVDETGFLRFVREAFAQKRKTLANNLRAAGYAPAAIHDAIARAEVPAQARAEALSLEVMAHLWIELKNQRGDPQPDRRSRPPNRNEKPHPGSRGGAYGREFLAVREPRRLDGLRRRRR